MTKEELAKKRGLKLNRDNQTPAEAIITTKEISLSKGEANKEATKKEEKTKKTTRKASTKKTTTKRQNNKKRGRIKNIRRFW